MGAYHNQRLGSGEIIQQNFLLVFRHGETVPVSGIDIEAVHKEAGKHQMVAESSPAGPHE